MSGLTLKETQELSKVYRFIESKYPPKEGNISQYEFGVKDALSVVLHPSNLKHFIDYFNVNTIKDKNKYIVLNNIND